MERYKSLAEYTPKEWMPRFPAEVEKGVILYDTQSKTILLQLKLWNCSPQMVTSVHLSIQCFDDAGIEVGKQEFRYMDLQVAPHQSFGSNTAIPLSNPITRRVEIEIIRVVLAGGQVIEGQTFERQPICSDILPLSSMGKQYLTEIANILRHKIPLYWTTVPSSPDEHTWICACGKHNRTEDACCVRCCANREELFHLFSRETLDAHYEKRMEEQRKAQKEKQERERLEALHREEEERLKEEQKKQKRRKRKKFLKRVLVVLAILLILGGGTAFLFKRQIYQFVQCKQASDLFEQGEYEAAAQKYIDSGVYTDTDDPVQECYYQQGAALVADGDYQTALKVYRHASKDYKDVSEKITELYYLWGKSELEEENFKQGRDYLRMANGYRDSTALIDQSYYDEGLAYMAEEKYVAAKSSFTSISNPENFPNCDALIAECEKWRIEGVLCKDVDDNWNPVTPTTVFDRWDEWHLWIKVTGGKPNEKLNLTITCNMPSGKVLVDSMDGFTSGERSDYYAYYEDPQYGETGDGVMIVTVTDTGEELGRYPFQVI